MINAAIVGYGRMGSGIGRDYGLLPKIWNPYSLKEAIELAPHMELRGVCDLNINAMINLPTEIKRFTSFKLMMEVVKPDFVAVTTRTQERSAIALSALESGIKMMHLEKPLCSSKRELSFLKSQFLKFDAKFSYGTIRRYLQPYKLVKKLISSGEFGELKRIVINYGRGELFWTHPHSIDLMLYFIGDYREMKIINISGETPLIEQEGDQINVITDPILNSARLIFDGRYLAEINSEPTSTASIFCGNHQFHIVEDGTKVFQIDEHGNEHLIWDEQLVIRPEGYSRVLEVFKIENSKWKTDNNLNQSMEDAFRGQDILFDMCIRLANLDISAVGNSQELKFLARSNHGLLA